MFQAKLEMKAIFLKSLNWRIPTLHNLIEQQFKWYSGSIVAILLYYLSAGNSI